jgi:glycosyltransferase involved in cell wall biosynthesis
VSVGIPVFNGEAYLEDAIRSVLAQDFDDLELVVCDNASTDRTREIIADWAASDRRVVALANPRNLGAAPNYNRVFRESRGTYFRWLAHDDRLLPGYLSRAVALLDARPEVVLCNALVEYIDAAGRSIGIYDSGLARADDPSPVRRFAAMVLHSHSCVDFFGLARREAMLGSLLHGPFHGADRAFLAQMALRGRLAQIKEPLVQMREHPNRYTRRHVRVADRARWHNASASRLSFPTWRLHREYLRLVTGESLGPVERLGALVVLVLWWGCNWNAVRAAVDVGDALIPGLAGSAERLKVRLFGPAPGHFL